MRHRIRAFRPPVITQCEHTWITIPAGRDHEMLDLTIRLGENTEQIYGHQNISPAIQAMAAYERFPASIKASAIKQPLYSLQL